VSIHRVHPSSTFLLIGSRPLHPMQDMPFPSFDLYFPSFAHFLPSNSTSRRRGHLILAHSSTNPSIHRWVIPPNRIILLLGHSHSHSHYFRFDIVLLFHWLGTLIQFVPKFFVFSFPLRVCLPIGQCHSLHPSIAPPKGNPNLFPILFYWPNPYPYKYSIFQSKSNQFWMSIPLYFFFLPLNRVAKERQSFLKQIPQKLLQILSSLSWPKIRPKHQIQ